MSTRTELPADHLDEPSGPQLSALGWARWAWRQLTSMRTALFLLMLLAVAAVPGSIFPQRGVDPTKVARYIADNPTTSPWLDRLRLFEVYSSPWFSAIYLLLFISLIGCVIPRTRLHLRSMRSRPPRVPANLGRLPAHVRFEAPHQTHAEAASAAASLLKKLRYRTDVTQAGVSAERGYLRETGNLVFHVALLGLLVSVALGSLLGYRGQVIVTQGSGFANAISQYDSIDRGIWVSEDDLAPFRLTLNSLDVKFEENAGGNQFAAARDFTAHVSVVDKPGDAPRQDTIKVNYPLDIDGTSVYLQGNGYAPVLTIKNAAGEVVSSGPTVFLAQDSMYTSNGVLKVPDTSPQIGLQAVFLPTMTERNSQPVSAFPDALNPRLFFTVYSGDLSLATKPQSVYQLDTTKLEQVREANGQPYSAMLEPGQSVKLPDNLGSVTFERLDRFVALQVRTDPVKGWAGFFSFLAMGGLALSLFIPRRRVFVRAHDEEGRIVLEIAGLARGEDPRLQAHVDEVAAQLGCPAEEKGA